MIIQNVQGTENQEGFTAWEITQKKNNNYMKIKHTARQHSRTIYSINELEAGLTWQIL